MVLPSTRSILLTLFMCFTFLSMLSTPKAAIDEQDKKFDWAEKRLIADLLYDYEKRARPVVDGSTPEAKLENTSVQQLEIHFGISLLQIIELDENSQILSVSVKSLYRWTDYHLIWNPKDYANIDHTYLSPDDIWLPDIALYNYADERLEEKRKCSVRVHYNGSVEWYPMAIYKSTCLVHMQYFPYDEQHCNLRFGPWTYDSARVATSNFNNKAEIEMEEYVTSPEWELQNSTVNSNSRKYPCCPERYTDMYFNMTIKRNAVYYNYILILPCLLLSSLTLVMFWLPPETPAKMVLGMNIYPAFFLLLLVLSRVIPTASSYFPMIGTYYCINMTLVTFSTFMCLIVVNFHFRGDRVAEVPQWMRKLLLHHGARLLFTKTLLPPPPPAKTAIEPVNKSYSANAQHLYQQLSGRSLESQMANQYPNFLRPSVDCTEARIGFPERSTSSERNLWADTHALTPDESLLPHTNGYLNDQTLYKQPNYYNSLLGGDFGGQTPGGSAFCPACAGLAVAAATAVVETAGQGRPELLNDPEGLTNNVSNIDPTEELASIWADALTSSSMSRHPQDQARSYDARECVDDLNSQIPYGQSFLMQCVRPSSTKGRHSKANRNANSGPYYPFTSPQCEMEDDNWAHSSTENIPRNSHSHQRDGCANRSVSNSRQDVKQTESGMTRQSRKNSLRNDPNFSRRVNRVKRDVKHIVRNIRFLQRENEEKDKINKIMTEWRVAGMVLDRIFFIVYMFVLGISIIHFFPRPKS